MYCPVTQWATHSPGSRRPRRHLLTSLSYARATAAHLRPPNPKATGNSPCCLEALAGLDPRHPRGHVRVVSKGERAVLLQLVQAHEVASVGNVRQREVVREILAALKAIFGARERDLQLLPRLPDPPLREAPLASHTRDEDLRVEVVVGPGHPDPRVRSCFRILGHKLRRLVDLVEILVHDVGLVEGVAVGNDHRNLPGRARFEELLALVSEVHLVGLELRPFFVQDQPGSPGERATLGAVKLDNYVPLLWCTLTRRFGFGGHESR